MVSLIKDEVKWNKENFHALYYTIFDIPLLDAKHVIRL